MGDKSGWATRTEWAERLDSTPREMQSLPAAAPCPALGMQKHAVIVIPTFNESGTIGRMIDRLVSQTFRQTDWRCSVLVVDGNSPDGTADVVRARMEKHPEVHLLVEKEKEGIGAAYFKGFQLAEETLGAEVLIEFDGDFQHPPESIPELLRAIDAGADMVLGSRRRKGGGYPQRWDPFRLFLSKVGGFAARVLMFFPFAEFRSITDPTTGLRATRVSGPYQRLDFDSFGTRGFGYKIEMLFRMAESGARISEIPLRFLSRETGESKMTQQAPLEILGTAFRLRLSEQRTRRFARFCVVGLSGVVVNAVLLELFVRAGFISALARRLSFLSAHRVFGFASQPAAWAAAFSIEGSIINNFLWNNTWTFRERRARRFWEIAGSFLSFNVLSIGGVVLQFCSVGIATMLLGNTPAVRQVTLFLSILLLVLPYNWLVYNKLVWRKKTD